MVENLSAVNCCLQHCYEALLRTPCIGANNDA